MEPSIGRPALSAQALYNQGMSSDETRGTLPTPSGPLYWLTLAEDAAVGGHDATVAAWLTAGELAHWDSLRTEKRRGDWLMGRYAAKRLITGVVEAIEGRRLSLNQISILPHPDGWPIVTLPDGSPPLSLSISHVHSRAFCAVMVGEQQLLGADVEAITPRSPAFVDDYFTALEREFLAATPPAQNAALVNAIWSGKEAALKAIRRGLAEDTRIVSCLPHPLMDGQTDWLPLRMKWLTGPSAHPMPPLGGLWRREGHFVLTLAYSAIFAE